jgi:hypothetical protein
MVTTRKPLRRSWHGELPVVTVEALRWWRAARAARPGTSKYRDAELELQRACGLGKFGPFVLTGAPSLIGADENGPLAEAWRTALEQADREAAEREAG